MIRCGDCADSGLRIRGGVTCARQRSFLPADDKLPLLCFADAYDCGARDDTRGDGAISSVGVLHPFVRARVYSLDDIVDCARRTNIPSLDFEGMSPKSRTTGAARVRRPPSSDVLSPPPGGLIGRVTVNCIAARVIT